MQPASRMSSAILFLFGSFYSCCNCFTSRRSIVATRSISARHKVRFVSTHSSISNSKYRLALQNSIGLFHINRPVIRSLPSLLMSHDCASSDAVTTDVNNVPTVSKSSSTQQRPQRKSLRQVLKVGVNREILERSDVQVIGHRGAIYKYLENTIESFLYCADSCQCNAVELDVFVIKDGTLVVFHGCDSNPNIPGSLEGYCVPGSEDSGLVWENDGSTYRSIIDLTYEETQQLQFNPNYEEFVCPRELIVSAKIPTLHDVLLQLSKTNLQEVKIELKGPGTVLPVLALVEKLQLETSCSYSSFDHEQLKELRALRPDKTLYRTGALFNAPVDDSDYIDRATMCGATAIHLRYDDCTVDRIQAIHDNDFISMAWFRGPMGMRYDALNRFNDIGGGSIDGTELNFEDKTSIIENDACYRTLLDTSVQQICCNRPDLLMKVLLEQ